MSDLPNKPRNIWLRSFYGFEPEEEGYIGWTEEGPRNRMVGLIQDGDLFLIYGATSGETETTLRSRVLGFLQIAKRTTRDVDRASPLAQERKHAKGWGSRWTYGVPVVRAWRAEERVMVQQIAPQTYRPEAGQAIATWNPPLLPEEIDRALRISVTEVSVFGEPPLPNIEEAASLAIAYQPSRAFPGSFGERTSTYKDGPTVLYLAMFEGDANALLGVAKPPVGKLVIMKIGVSNNVERRLNELNSGFPPAAKCRWTMQLVSQPYEGFAAAESAEAEFKIRAVKGTLKSLGEEFFYGGWTDAQLLFATIPGVARFGGLVR